MQGKRRLIAAAGVVAVLGCLALGGCIPPSPEPSPAPAPAPAPDPAPTPAPAPPPARAPENWMDAPQTPGDWNYAAGSASFGEAGAPLLVMRCDLAARQVEIARRGAGPAASSLRILTETQERVVGAASGVARLPANDRLLDAMAFSKGRFAVEAAGVPTIYVPAWPEVTRVIEECR